MEHKLKPSGASQAAIEEVIKALSDQVGSTTQFMSTAVVDASSQQQTSARSSQRVIVGSTGGLVLLLSTFGGWVMDKADEWDKQQKAVVTMTDKLNEMEIRQKIMANTISAIKDHVISMDVGTADGIEMLRKKLEKTSRRAAQIEIPKTVEAHVKRAEDTVKGRRLDDVFRLTPVN